MENSHVGNTLLTYVTCDFSIASDFTIIHSFLRFLNFTLDDLNLKRSRLSILAILKEELISDPNFLQVNSGKNIKETQFQTPLHRDKERKYNLLCLYFLCLALEIFCYF